MRRFDRIVPGGAAATTLTLSFERRARSRQRVVLDDGSAALVVLPRGTLLRDGDCIADAAGIVVRIHAAPEPLSTAASADPAMLVRAAYHLGNRHVAVQIGPGWLRYLHDHVLDAMLRAQGLEVGFAELPFEPEAGAYGPAPGDHDHGPGHAHPHALDHA